MGGLGADAPRPLICFAQYGAADTMTGDLGNRVRGEGVLDGGASFVIINGQRELLLVYKTQGEEYEAGYSPFMACSRPAAHCGSRVNRRIGWWRHASHRRV